MTESDNRITGVVKFFNDARGFGFIVRDDNSEEVFVHRANLAGDNRELSDGDRVSFQLGKSRKGNGHMAVEVQVIGEAV